MKKLCFITIALLPILLFSCKVEKNEMKNGKGASAAAYWLDATEDFLMLFPDVAFKFNAWLTTPAEKKDSIKSLYFPNYDIVQRDAKTWAFQTYGETIFEVNTNGYYNLNNPNASWIVGWEADVALAGNPYHRTYLDNGGCTSIISRMPNDSSTWTIRAVPFNSHGDFPALSVISLTLPDNTVPATLVGRDFSVSGEGFYYFYAMRNKDKDVYYCQSFDIKDGQIKNFKGLAFSNLWTSGDLSMRIIADWDTLPTDGIFIEEENVKARFYTKGNKQHASITLHGVQEEWVLPDPQPLRENARESSFIEWLFPWF